MRLSVNKPIQFLYLGLIVILFLSVKGCNKNPSDLVPDGHVIFEKISGDLNNDGINDSIFIVKSTSKEVFFVDEDGEKLDRNRRGIMVFLSENDIWKLTSQNLSCFSSENEDGGIYFPPELSVHTERGNLYLHYGHGRYGYSKYTFRFNNPHFELIEYISSVSHGPVIEEEIILKYQTKKKLKRVNANENSQNDSEATFEDTWTDIQIEQLIKLSEIVDFDELDLRNSH